MRCDAQQRVILSLTNLTHLLRYLKAYIDIMGRSPCCNDENLKKGPWTVEEDEKLTAYINKNGLGSWRSLPKLAGLNRCGKSCRLRWTNYLRPDIKRGKFSQEEEKLIINLHAVLGNKYKQIHIYIFVVIYTL